MIRKPSTPRRAPGFSERGHRRHRPRAHLARLLLPLLILAIVVLPGCGPSNPPPPPAGPCAPGTVCSALVVPDCTSPPGLTTPPAAPRPLQALPDSLVPAKGGGLLPGRGSVSATGEYQYRIPIDVPAGRAGVQPSLALAYSSRGGNGHLGVGWQLEGLSEVNRCAKTFATEGYADGVNFDGDDVFCLDGHKLIAVSGSYGADGTEYRTEEDSFARITLYRSPKQRIDRFVVQTKEGRIRTYAPPEPLTSYDLPGGKSREVISWPLREEHDRSGNSILYSYERQGALAAYPLQNGGDFLEYYPARIDYTRNVEEAPGSGPRSVRFEYEKREDVSVAYLHGVAFKTTLRLKSILLDAPNPLTPELVWRYDLAYERSPGSGRSRLTAVQRCGVQHDGSIGGCLDAKRFTWNQDPQGPTYAKEAVWDSSLDEPALVGDFDGDGRAEILSRNGSSVRFTLDPEHPLAEQCHPTGLLFGTKMAEAKLADIYGDGRPRILAAFNGYYFILELNYIASTSGAGLGCELSYTSILLGEFNDAEGRWPIHVTDLDGDGLPDLIKGESTSNPDIWSWHYRLNSVQLDPQVAWAFGPSHVAPLTTPPARAGFLNVSFSTDVGAHRGVIFPGTKHDAATGAPLPNFYGFGLSADGTPFATSVNDLGLSYFPDTNFAAFGDTDGDGVRNPVGYLYDKGTICLERTCHFFDLHALAIKPEEWHVETADLDSDGQDELLLVHTAGKREVVLFRLNAQGGIDRSDAPFPAPTAIGDFNGDGLLDILVGDANASSGNTAQPAIVYRQTGSGTTDRIVAVHNAGDPGDSDPSARETIVYSNAPFTDMGTICRYPQRCMRQGFTVVREHDVYQGPEVATSGPPVRRHLFTYEDPRFDVRGRGFLGFGTVRQWDVARAAETTTTYDNATSDDNGLRLVYPGALKPKTVLRVVPMDDKRKATSRDARLSKTSYSYELVRLNQGATYFVHPSAWDSIEWE